MALGPGLELGVLLLCSCSLFLLLAEAEECPTSFYCGHLDYLSFPFVNTTNPDCPGVYVRGCDDQFSPKEVYLGNEHKIWLQVNSITNYYPLNVSMSVQDSGLQKLLSQLYSTEYADCSKEDLHNVTLPLPSPILSFEKVYDALTLVVCDTPPKNYTEYFSNYASCDDFDFYVLQKGAHLNVSSGYTIYQVPAKLQNASPLSYSAEFTIKVNVSEDCRKCYMNKRGGHCRLDHKGKFLCASGDQEHEFVNVLIVATAASATVVAMLMVLNFCFRRKASILFWKGENQTHQKIELFLKRHEVLLTKRYTYSEIREMTNSFKHKLGQGGFGSVYKGKLPDGRVAAVKVLNESKGNGEEFINEVASISQTSHVNVVSLFGFCFQGSKRALVYEFMPNGSLEKFIYENRAAIVDRQLDCKTLHDIAIGTARGLEYLHKGCNTRILHFDIKPHNILLDVDFCPKISDFGLSKICPRKESIVSMLGPRGTAGYIAPEVFSRNFGDVSHKSDVYSFGMMVLEMVGGRKNINVEVECSSEIYFPHWIYKSLETNQELALRCIRNENDNEMVRKMILVSLWCIQTDPSTRPAMSKVVDILEGSLESLQIPPKPFLSSPKSSPAHYSTSNLET